MRGPHPAPPRQKPKKKNVACFVVRMIMFAHSSRRVVVWKKGRSSSHGLWSILHKRLGVEPGVLKV